MRKQHFLLMGSLSILLSMAIAACQNSTPPKSLFQCGSDWYPLNSGEQPDYYNCVHLPDSMQVIQQFLTDLENNKQMLNNQADSISKAIIQLRKLPPTNSYLAITKFLKYQSVAVNAANKEQTLTLLREATSLLNKYQSNKCDSVELLVLHSYLSYYLDNDFGKGEEAILHTQIAIDGILEMNRIKEVALEYANLAKLYTRYHKPDLADAYLRKALCIWENVEVENNEELYVYAHAVHSVAVLNYTKGLQHYQKREIGQAAHLFNASLSSLASLLELSKVDSFNQNLIADIRVKAVTSIGKIYLTGHKVIDKIPSFDYFQPVLNTIESQEVLTQQQTKAKIYPSLAFILAKMDSLDRANTILAEGLNSLFIQNFKDSLTQYSPQNIIDHWDLIKGLNAKANIEKIKFIKTNERPFLEAALHTELNILSYLEQVRQEMATDEAKEAFMEQASIHYSQANKTALDLYQKTQNDHFLAVAFQISDQGKSVVLRQEINNKLKVNEPTVAFEKQAIWEKEKVLKQKIWQLKQKFHAAAAPKLVNNSIRDSILFYSQTLQAFKSQLAIGNKIERNYSVAQSAGKIPSIQEIQRNWLDDKTAILAYQVGFESAAVFVITKFEKALIPITVDSTIFILNQQLQESLQFGLAYFPEEAYQIYHKIIAPAKPFLQDNQLDQLVIIPDDVITQIPFAALVTKKVQEGQQRVYNKLPYLINDFTISYLPSLSIYQVQQQLDIAQEKHASNFAAFIANPADSQLQPTASFDTLFTQQESINLIDMATQRITKKHFQPTDLIRQATKSDFNKIAPEAKLLHLSLHGINDAEKHFLNNYLSFTPDSLDNGQLTLGEIYGMDLNADLTFLASCNSGQGDLHASEGLLSIQRAFLYAGCKGTISTLQAVEDKRAAEITQNFYHYFRERGFSITFALAMAQREYIQTIDPSDENRAHPANWANYRYSGINALNPLVFADQRAAPLYSLE